MDGGQMSDFRFSISDLKTDDGRKTDVRFQIQCRKVKKHIGH
jgi:hypothetical protein